MSRRNRIKSSSRQKKRLVCEYSIDTLMELEKKMQEISDKMSEEYQEILKKYEMKYKESCKDLNIYFSKNESIEGILNRSFSELIKAMIREKKIRRRNAISN